MEVFDFTRGAIGADGMSYVITLVVVVAVIILLSYVLKYFYPSKGETVEYVTSPFDATSGAHVKKVPSLPTGQPQTLGFWVYVNDWNQKWSVPKYIVNVPGHTAENADGAFKQFQVDSKQSNPLVMFYPQTNKMAIRVSTIGKSGDGESGASIVSPWQEATRWNPTDYFVSTKTCDIDNIPLNRWVSIVVVYTGVSMDIQRDGHLQRSCVLDNVTVETLDKLQLVSDEAYSNGTKEVGGPGFKGRMGRTMRASRAFKSDEVLAWHNRGPGGERSDGLLALLGLDRLFLSYTDLDGNEIGTEINF